MYVYNHWYYCDNRDNIYDIIEEKKEKTMKTFIRGILTTVLVFTFILIPTIMYAEQIVNQEIIGTYGKEEVIKQMSESLKNEFPEITDENIKELEDSLRTNETIDNLMNKYTDKIMKDLTTDEIEDINIEEDLKTFIEENKTTIEQATGQSISDEKLDELLEEVTQNEDINASYKKMIEEAKNSMPEEGQVVLNRYQSVTTDNFMMGLIITSIISIVIIALLKKPYYKWIVNIAIAGIVSALFIALIGGSIALVLNVAIEIETVGISAMPMLITSGIMLLVSIVLIVINSILDSRKAKRHAVS